MDTNYFPFVIVGSGVAGLSLALRLANLGKVCVINKSNRKESASYYAQGGMAVASGELDSIQSHIDDTLRAGSYFNNRKSVKILCHEGVERMQEIVALGLEFTKKYDNTLDLHKEGGHSIHRIAHVKDHTGKAMLDILLERSSKNKNITFWDNHMLLELITAPRQGILLTKLLYKLLSLFKKGISRQCCGLYAIDMKTKKMKILLADYTCLATGGIGQLYLNTTNPMVSTGDGIAIAHRASCQTKDLEFMQFHPTALYYNISSSFLLTEALRGVGARLYLQDGTYFMEKYDVRGELASRDIIAYAIATELQNRKEKFVYLDMTHLPKEKIKTSFPMIFTTLKEKFDLDMTQIPIPVAPAAHYLCGGIKVNFRSQTSLKSLYAVGENACTGVHGANRLASNSLLEALVFSHRAYLSIRNKYTVNLTKLAPKLDMVKLKNKYKTREFDFSLDKIQQIEDYKKQIQTIMHEYANILRTSTGLKQGLNAIKIIEEKLEDFLQPNYVNCILLEVRNMCLGARLILQAAIKRKTSVGLHYKID